MMVDLTLSSTPVSVRALTCRLENLSMKSFKGENIITAVSPIRCAVALLDNNEALPMDIEKIVLKVLKTTPLPSSTPLLRCSKIILN